MSVVVVGIAVLGLTAGQDATSPAPAQDPQTATVLEDVIVLGRRGSTDLIPERELGADEIDALNAWDIGEVISRLGETFGDGQSPVVIINGRRILDPGNFTGFPPDAISRVEVLPPEAAALYGEDPSRRVLNVVLVPEFRSREGLADLRAPTAGGASGGTLEGRQSSIQGDDTHQYGLQVSRDTALWASDRPGYRDGVLPDGDVTLRPESRSVTANAAVTATLGDWAASFNATGTGASEQFRTAAGEARQRGHSLSLNGGLGGEWGGWTVRSSLNGTLSEGRQEGLSEVRSRTMGLGVQGMASRPLFSLPAGPVQLNLNGRWSRTESRTQALADEVRRSSSSFDLRGGLGVPLSRSMRRGRSPTAEGGRWGDLSLTLGGQVGRSGGSDLRGGANGGLSWAPIRQLRMSGQWSVTVDSPSDGQRYDPVIQAPPRTVYDFQTGEAVEIAPVIGGNPDLRPQRQDRLTVSAAMGPFTTWRMQGSLTWARLEATDQIGAVPLLSPAAEAAFPERFLRDQAGRLVGIDLRPINMASARSDTLSVNLGMSLPLGARVSDRALQVGLTQRWSLTDTLTIREGYPVLDRLAGDGGGAGRGQTSLRLDLRLAALGVNVDARRREGGRVRRTVGVDGPDDLRLATFNSVDVKVSYRFRPPAGEAEARQGGDGGLRLELEVANLFDARPRALLGDGRSAPGYGRDDRDPVGRTVRLSLSRRF